MRFRRSLAYMSEANASVPPDPEPPASFTPDSSMEKTLEADG
jgi:hypothetical protein